jgi:hypothetical protein
MKEELKEKYDTYLALTKGRRTYNFVFFVLLVWLCIAWFPIMITGLVGLVVVWGVILIILIASLKKIPSPPITPPENAMFLNLYDTLRNIEFYFKDSESKIHLTRASRSLYNLSSSIRGIIGRDIYSVIVKTMNEPLRKLSDNLEKRVLPLIQYSNNQKDIQQAYSKLESLAFIFIEPTTIAQNLSMCNQILEKIPEPKFEITKVGMRTHLNEFGRSKIGQLTISLIGGYLLILLGSLVYCSLLNIEFAVYARDNPILIFGVGATISALIETILIRK